MGLFGFGKKKDASSQESQMPSFNQGPPPLPDLSGHPDLPPLPPLDGSGGINDIPQGLPGSPSYEAFDQTLDAIPLPPAPLTASQQQDMPSAGKQDSVDWSAPVEHPDRLPDDSSPPTPQEAPVDVSSLPTLHPLPPLPASTSPGASQDNGHESQRETVEDSQENLINIELPAFEG